MSYRQVVDDASGDQPLSTVGPAPVAAGQRRAGKPRRWGAYGTGAAAAVLAAVATAAMLPVNTPSQPTEQPRMINAADTLADSAASARSTGAAESDPADPTQRIDEAIFASLRRQAPGIAGVGLPGKPPVDLAEEWNHSGGENTADLYWGQGRIVVGGVVGLFSVAMYRENPGFVFVKCGENTATYKCEAGKGPHGERYLIGTYTPQNGSFGEQMINIVRKDGTCLIVDLTSDMPERNYALTARQQLAVAFDQAIALADE